jgi:hypothetical protein
MSKFNAATANPDIRLVAIDLDGTLLDDRKQVSHKAGAALMKLNSRGVKVVIASARPPRSVRHIYAALQLDTLQINYNGALIWDPPAKKAAFHRPLAGRVVRQVIEHARRLHPDVLVSCELLDKWYTDRPDQTYTTETGRMFKPDFVVPLKDFLHVSMTKILLLGEAKMMADIHTSLDMTFEEEINLVRAEPELIQIMDKRVDKAAALEFVANHYGVPMANVLAIGDAANDVGMLRAAGIAVAMDNAHSSIKKIADWIAPSNNDHGVHAALVKYGLSE